MPTRTVGRHSEIGYEARLQRRGAGRYVSAAFLGAWLCGWLMGECFALWVLIRGAVALLPGEPLKMGFSAGSFRPSIRAPSGGRRDAGAVAGDHE